METLRADPISHSVIEFNGVNHFDPWILMQSVRAAVVEAGDADAASPHRRASRRVKSRQEWSRVCESRVMICEFFECGSWIVWLAGLRVGGIADAYCTSWDCLLAGLQAVGCRDCQRVGLRGRWDCRSWDCESRVVGLRVEDCVCVVGCKKKNEF